MVQPSSSYVDLPSSSCEAHLVSNVRTSVCNVPTRLGQDTLVVVTVKERVLGLLAALSIPSSRPSTDPVDLEAGRLEDDDEPSSRILLNGRLGRCGRDRDEGWVGAREGLGRPGRRGGRDEWGRCRKEGRLDEAVLGRGGHDSKRKSAG